MRKAGNLSARRLVARRMSGPVSPSPPTPPWLVDELEASLRDLLGDFPEARPPGERGPGRPPILAAAMLWLGFLLCVLRGFSAQRAVWRLVALPGFWGPPPIPLT